MDLFISHASEDKEAVARPLAIELQRRGWRVWFDEFELGLGDSLRRQIERGLAEARFGVVVLSRSFFAKEWPQRELDGLTAREIAGQRKVILPVWHDVDHAYVARYSPTLADKLAVTSAGGVLPIADQVERVLGAGRTVRVEEANRGRDDLSQPPRTPLSDASNGQLNGEAITSMLISGNQVALREALRAVRQRLERSGQAAAREVSHDDQNLLAVWPQLGDEMAAMVELTAPLVRNDFGATQEQAAWIGRLAAKTYPSAETAESHDLPALMAFGIAQATAAYALSVDALPVVRALFEAPVRYEVPATRVVLACVGPGHATAGLSNYGGGQWAVPWFEAWCAALRSNARLQQSAVELFENDPDAPRQRLLDVSFLATIYCGSQGEMAAAPWTAYVSGGMALASRLSRDSAYRAQVATELLGVSPAEFTQSAKAWLRIGLGGGRPVRSGPIVSRARLDFATE